VEKLSRPAVLSNPGYCFRLKPRVDEDPLNFRYLPFVRNGTPRSPTTRKMLFSLPIPRGRLDHLYRMCVSTYAESKQNAFHPRFREVYDGFMDELVASQLTDFNIEGYLQLCVEDLFERDIFAQRRGTTKSKVNGNGGN
jgi:hypothetical protein